MYRKTNRLFLKTITALLFVVVFFVPLRVFAVVTDPIDIYVVPAITNDVVLPDSSISSEYLLSTMSLRASPGEFESVSFVIHANQTMNSLTVEATDLTGSGGTISSGNIDIKVVKVWYQAGRLVLTPYYDKNAKFFVPELLLNDDSLVKIENGENYLKMNGSYTWISKVGTSKELPSLNSTFPVQDSSTLQSFNVSSGTNKQIWITVKVPESANAGNYTGQIKVRNSAGVIKQLTLNLEVLPIDLADSSIDYSIFYIGKISPSRAGEISGGYKTEEQLAAELKDLMDHGVTSPAIYQPAGNQTYLGKFLTAMINAGMNIDKLYYAGLQPWGYQSVSDVTAVLNFVSGYGVSDVYFYAEDEAKGSALTAQRSSWEAIRAAGGKIMASCYIDAFGLVGDILDLAIFHGTPLASEAAKWHSAGHEMGNYSNPQVGREEPETFRRNFGLLLWQNDVDVAMDFAYYYPMSHVWNDFDHEKYRDHNFTYPTIDGVIDTIQWEGFREGVDDVRYVSTLSNLVSQGVGNTSYAQAYLNYLKTADIQERDLDDIRSEVIGHILYLLGESSTHSWCGNGVIDSGEACDGTNFGGKSCSTFGYSGGSLSCNVDCTINKCNCTPSATSISFTSPTKPNGTVTNEHLITVNTSVNSDCYVKEDCNNVSSFINWDNSLLGYWKLDEGSGSTVYDSSGNGHNGTLINSPQWRTGRFGSALEFDGTAKYVNIPDSSSNDLDGKSAITVEAWVYQDYNHNYDQGIVGDDWFVLRDSGWASFILINSSGVNSGYIGQAALEQGKWHHIVGTYDSVASGKNMKLYVDGRLESEKSFSGTLATGGAPLKISRSSGSATYWDGKIDEIKIWGRALTEQEIKASYNAGLYQLSFDSPYLSDGTYEYYAFAIDGSGRTNQTETRTLTIDSTFVNHAPVLVSVGSKTVNEGETLTFTVSATDQDGDSLTYTATNLPTGSAFSNNIFTWTPTHEQAGTYTNVCFTVTDGDLEDSECITITVVDVQQQTEPPTISFVSPTPANNSTITTNQTTLKATSDSDYAISSYLDWNRSLVGYWKFDEGAGLTSQDSSTYSNNGTLKNNPQWSTGNFSEALSFDGANDYVEVPNDSDFNVNNITVEAWIKPDTTSGTRAIIERYNWEAGKGTFALRQSGDDVIFFNIYGIDYYPYVRAQDVIQANQWLYAAATFDGSMMKIYINGELENEKAETRQLLASDDVLAIGKTSHKSGNYFDGLIDEVKIWNRALSEQEIKASYNAKVNTLETNLTDLVNGSYSYYAKVTDESGNIASTETRTLTVGTTPQNHAPVLGSIGSKTVNEGETLTFTVTAQDQDGDSLTYTATNLPTGSTFSNKTFTWTPTYAQSGTYTNVCFTVSDGSLTDQECITITVTDATEPCTATNLLIPVVTPSSPYNTDTFTISCGAENSNFDCINAKVDTTNCTFSNWSQNNAIFTCPVQTAGSHTAYCYTSTNTTQNCCSKETTKTFTVQEIQPPTISFVSPTPSNGTTITTNQTTIKATSDSDYAISSYLDWNQSLVGYWTFNEGTGLTSQDNSTYTNTATLKNGTTWTQGKRGKALLFDGTDDYVEVPDSSSLDLTTALTIEAWVYPESYPTTYARVISKETGNYADPFAIERFGAADLRLVVKLETTTANEDIAAQAVSLPALNLWTHLVATWDGNIGKIYYNGVQSGSDTYLTGTLKQTTNPVIIGNAPTFVRQWDGKIDEVKIYNRALTEKEVKASYNAKANTLEANLTNLTNGTYTYLAKVTDELGNITSTEERTLIVSATTTPQNHAPVLGSIGSKTVNEGETLTFTVTAQDQDGDSLTYTATNLPTGSTFSNKTFTWEPTYIQSGTYTNVCFTVSDGELEDSECITITVSDATEPCAETNLERPIVTPSSPYNTDTFTISCGAENSNFDCIGAKVDTTNCTFSNWSQNKAIFTCPVQTAGSHTAYCYTSTNTTQNCCSKELDQTFTVRSADTTVPGISNVRVTDISTSSAEINWTTAEPATGQVEYGLTTSYGSFSYQNPGLELSHVHVLRNLSASTTYNFRVISEDSTGNTSQSVNYTFTTQADVVLDTILPGRVTDLAVGNTGQSNVTLTWTSPGDDGNIGTALSYDVRYSTEEIMSETWNDSQQATGEPTPKLSGSEETFQVVGLTPSTTYYFALKSKDEASNESPLSNVVHTTTQTPLAQSTGGGTTLDDTVAPYAPSSFGAKETDSQVVLSWKNPTDTDFVRVIVKRSTAGYPLTPTEGITVYEGTATSFVDTGLVNGNTYYYSIFAYDQAPNYSNKATLKASPKEGVEYIGQTASLETEKPLSEMTIEELEAKVAELLSLIAQLQAELNALQGGTIYNLPSSFRFTNHLYLGTKNQEVSYLQEFLKAQGTSIYPEGLVTGYFGPLTLQATINFQLTHGIISSLGDLGAGHVGPKTRAKINEMMGE